MTSLRLLERFQKVADTHPNLRLCAHIDSTHSLNWNEFPVVVLGYSDMSGRLHPLAFAVMSHERNQDVSWFLGSLRTLFEDLYGYVYVIVILGGF